MKLTPEQLKENYDKLINVIETTFTGQRKSNLLLLFNDFDEQILLAPASSYVHLHNAFPGGYVLHTLNVINNAVLLHKVWAKCGANMTGYTTEELIFVALCHDLGKIGAKNIPYYISNESEWHIKHQGKYYETNPELGFMRIQDRSLLLLNQYGILLTENEYIAILVHDGLYDEGNKPYYNGFNEEQKPATNLIYIIHQADMMSCRIEFEQWKLTKDTTFYTPSVKSDRSNNKLKSKLQDSADISTMIDNIFKTS